LESLIGYLFRGIAYTMTGFFLEVVYSVVGIERSVGAPIPRRVPQKYLEGFVSLYMLPIHGIGMVLGFEPMVERICHLNVFVRFIIYAVAITGSEAIGGWVYDKLFGFYSWDYYKLSPYRVFKRGYTLWTLLPQWGLAGLVLEQVSLLLQHLTPSVV
jgi:uncharacterized membrane protein